ncbi:uncharacterized protein EAF02_002196 [Botrytis sinoallii]|uniref:MARVEL domain-containing protein n=2 Tax=Botrytis TaxID=33196 RepID=A0A4Z1JJ69_9HELO|nr:uncharacterized protein EAF02_002196 [Botrytis sinoallii]XP_038812469.1 uncharacterized protein EAE98_003385 [Botrytis deweyae]KAF7920658.1 hypothetical protein EAE99_007952 [Botrytis elliptica]KAF7889781.1 hypothetical protein EAF02_002196 [Botrytis sinoallii]KAF7933676.1 hypothetical protein EAE98_003385 [Botrytis deweyae]TGO73741.1 hypothetical protein BELL_0335g00060 [Botrytis elliptica]
MTRVYVYSVALAVFIAATTLTFVSIFIPDWITWDVTTPNGNHVTKSIGLHRSYSSLTGHSSHFPTSEDCAGPDRGFCSMWRSVGFLMSFAAVVELVTLVAYVVVLFGGKQKRETGWKILAFLLVLVGIVQAAGMSIVAYLYDHDEQFFPGWKLDKGWIFCTISWCLSIASAAGIAISAFALAPEDGYELIPSERSGGISA